MDERAAKLAAMQQAASDLDRDREKRLAAIADRDAAEREADEAARAKSARYGGKGEFITRANRMAGGLDVAERIRRERGALTRDADG